MSYLEPSPSIDSRKLILLNIAIRIHLHNLLIGWRPQNLYNLYQLIDVAVTSENRLQCHHLD